VVSETAVAEEPEPEGPSEYELLRAANIARNNGVLNGLGLGETKAELARAIAPAASPRAPPRPKLLKPPRRLQPERRSARSPGGATEAEVAAALRTDSAPHEVAAAAGDAGGDAESSGCPLAMRSCERSAFVVALRAHVEAKLGAFTPEQGARLQAAWLNEFFEWAFQFGGIYLSISEGRGRRTAVLLPILGLTYDLYFLNYDLCSNSQFPSFWHERRWMHRVG
jgi:hypothetical protein